MSAAKRDPMMNESPMTLQARRRLILTSLSFSVTGATGAAWLAGTGADARAAGQPGFDALLESPIRTSADLKADAGRKPLELLRFSQVGPGMTVLDVSAGGGYTTQMMALAVGPKGKVLAQVTQLRPALEQRLAQQPQANIEVLVRPFEDLYPADAPRVDLVTLVQSYHDIVNTPTDRTKMNRAMFAALKPGGRLVLIDHAGRSGTGLQETKSLHRIDEKLVRAEIEAAGFMFDADSAAWRNAADPRDVPSAESGNPGDRFALRFVRPRQP
jgi:predicted methyltransferase